MQKRNSENVFHMVWNESGMHDGSDYLVGKQALLKGLRASGLQPFVECIAHNAMTVCVWMADFAASKAFARIVAVYSQAGDFKISQSGADEFARVKFEHESGRKVYFQFPALTEAWGLGELACFSPHLAVDALLRFQALMGADVIYKPAGTGLRAIRGYYARIGKLETLTPPANGLEPFIEHGPGAVLWTRPLTDEEQSAPYLHAYDKRASYLHAADVACGVGDWTHGLGWSNKAPGAELMPGVYRLEFRWSPDDLFLFDIRLRQYIAMREWFYAPMVKTLQQLGYQFSIRDAYYFSAKKQVLKPWRDTILKGIEEGLHVRKVMKSVYTQTIGMLGSSHMGDKSDTLFRPDWRGQVVDEASARMLHNVARVAKLSREIGHGDHMPVAIYDDCLFYVSPSPDPFAATPILTTQGNMAAKFQYKGSYRVNDEVRELLKGSAARFSVKIGAHKIGGAECLT